MLADSLAALCRQENCTPFMGLLAAFQALLGRYSSQDDVVVGAGRSGAVLGIGGDAVTGSERRFRDRLTHALQL